MSDSTYKFPHKREFILGAYLHAISASADPLRELICILNSQQMRVLLMWECLFAWLMPSKWEFICHACTDHKVSATIVPCTLLAITRQLLQLERCSNPLQIQQV